jgi:hypothetical protein
LEPRNETFEFGCSASTPKVYCEVYDHHTLGRDKLLGEAEIDVRGPPILFLLVPG